MQITPYHSRFLKVRTARDGKLPSDTIRYHTVRYSELTRRCFPTVMKLQVIISDLGKVRGQKDSSDTGFRAKFNIFNPTIPNTL